MCLPDIPGDSGRSDVHRIAFKLLFQALFLMVQAVKPLVVLLVAELAIVSVEEGHVLESRTQFVRLVRLISVIVESCAMLLLSRFASVFLHPTLGLLSNGSQG